MAQVNEVSAMSSDPGASEAQSHRWTLKYGDRVYGPYSFDTMKSYITEGRVAEHSLLAPEGTPAGAGMWQYAIDIPVFTKLLLELLPLKEESEDGKDEDKNPASAATGGTAAMDPVTARAGEAGALTTSEGEHRPVYGPGKGQVDRRSQPETANFIIVMDIKARFAAPHEQAIMSLGPAYRLAAIVWCVNTDATAAGMLNDLSPYIGRTDTMFIADTTRDRTAWSSMGPEVDAKIRRVWRRTY
ncbi:MAG: hypothetical protein K9G30_04995 [Parvibaculum sp.]|nr:hypothetical protein [Parvibaculum sp.]